MNGMLRVPRSRGVLSGVLLILLGAWGALVPFVGPYFQYAYTPDHALTYTTGRLWLSILPGAATVLGGLIVLISASRPLAHFGAWLAALSGAWFALGSVIGPTWIGTQMAAGTPVGGSSTRALEQIGFYTGLGVAIVLVAAMALGRFSVIGVREARVAEPVTPAVPAEPVTTGAAARTGAGDRPATADKPATAGTPAMTGTGGSRRFGLRHKEATAETAEPAAEPVSPGNM